MLRVVLANQTKHVNYLPTFIYNAFRKYLEYKHASDTLNEKYVRNSDICKR